ncbi:MAG TPA: sulfite exporter TauE/SafE family protein [Methylophilaceae bacterium]|nr:sulfite exporter TauE/SafE family protein [Methylophilaceae bacterium]
MDSLLYLLAGALAGLLSGLFGVGGGLIIVPILVALFSLQHFPDAHIMHLALGSSLATIVVTSLASASAHHRRDNVDWAVVGRISPGIVLGTLLGTQLATCLDSDGLKAIFAIFVLAVATQMLLNLRPNPHRQLPGSLLTSLVGGVIGIVSSLVGIGGGTLSVPFLLYCNTAIHRAIGTSAAIGLPIALAGATGYVLAGWGQINLPQYSVGFLYLPAVAGIALASSLTAPFGVMLAQRFSAKGLKRLFAILLYGIGVKMAWGLF